MVEVTQMFIHCAYTIYLCMQLHLAVLSTTNSYDPLPVYLIWTMNADYIISFFTRETASGSTTGFCIPNVHNYFRA